MVPSWRIVRIPLTPKNKIRVQERAAARGITAEDYCMLAIEAWLAGEVTQASGRLFTFEEWYIEVKMPLDLSVRMFEAADAEKRMSGGRFCRRAVEAYLAKFST